LRIQLEAVSVIARAKVPDGLSITFAMQIAKCGIFASHLENFCPRGY
jgi:hypothetical protein